jgi:acetyl esterase/lipase
VLYVTPPDIPPGHRDYVLLNMHGGGFVVDSGSFTESIPMASLTRTRVVSVLYPLAPEHPFPAALDAAVAVYRALLKTYPADHIVIYGTSAGAILTGEIAVALKQRGLPEPAALGIFSGLGDFSRPGDSASLFALNGLSGYLAPPRSGARMNPEYVGRTDPRDPVLSPLFADLHGLPPTLFITSTRDLLLSGTTILHRAFRRAGVDAQLVVFEALPHTFWNDPELPESTEAHQAMADFFNAHLYGASGRSGSAAARH